MSKMVKEIVNARFDAMTDSVVVTFDDQTMVLPATKIQEVITALLESHSQYFDEMLRRSDHGKD
jgi:hypothetical protein